MDLETITDAVLQYLVSQKLECRYIVQECTDKWGDVWSNSISVVSEHELRPPVTYAECYVMTDMVHVTEVTEMGTYPYARQQHFDLDSPDSLSKVAECVRSSISKGKRRNDIRNR